MLPSKRRLSREDDIRALFGGRGARSEYASLKFRKNSRQESRFSFVVPSKNIKKATLRNLLKRRARAIVWKNLLKIREGYDILFLFSAKAGALDYNLLEGEILSLFSRAGLAQQR